MSESSSTMAKTVTYRPVIRVKMGRKVEPPNFAHSEDGVFTWGWGSINVDGVLQEAMAPIAREHHSTILGRIKIMSELDIAERRVPQDGRFRVKYNGRAIDFRVSIMPSIHGEDAVLRVLDKETLSEKFRDLSLDVVGFDPGELKRFRRYIHEPYGMVLVTGPTGSGKTTTLYAAINEIKSDEDKFITIEDPVEYRLPHIRQTQVNPKAGITIASGMRSI